MDLQTINTKAYNSAEMVRRKFYIMAALTLLLFLLLAMLANDMLAKNPGGDISFICTIILYAIPCVIGFLAGYHIARLFVKDPVVAIITETTAGYINDANTYQVLLLSGPGINCTALCVQDWWVPGSFMKGTVVSVKRTKRGRRYITGTAGTITQEDFAELDKKRLEALT